MPILPDGKIAFAPAGDIVELGGVTRGPPVRGFANLGAYTGDLSGQRSGLLGSAAWLS
jgi:hypothetical protein